LSSPHLEASPATTFHACSSPAPTPVKPQPALAILSQESVHTTLSITHHSRKRPSTGPRTTHGPQWSNGSISQAPIRCRHPHRHYLVLIVLLLPLFRGFSPVYITEHIPKYCSIENVIKLPFQWVLIHLNRSPNERAMAVLFPLLHAVQKISEHAIFGNSAISACRNLWLTWFLIRWKRNFMGLLNIQRYPVILPWGCAEIDTRIDFLRIDLKMLTTLILWSSGRYVASPSALSHCHCWTSE
jgi:hypothetical protein